MFGIGGQELLVILVVALLVLGPKKLPDVARTLGKALGEFRKVSTEFQRTLNTEIALDETQKAAQQKTNAVSDPRPASPEASAASTDTSPAMPPEPQPNTATQPETGTAGLSCATDGASVSHDSRKDA